MKYLHESRALFISTHGLAECYNALTRYPIEGVLLPSQAQDLLKERFPHKLKTIELTKNDYEGAFERVARKNLRGAVVYDALHYQAAIKIKAEKLITWNVKDFERLSSGEFEILTPLQV